MVAVRGLGKGTWLLFAFQASGLVGRLDRQREVKGGWWCRSQLSEHRILHREGAQRRELLTALEAGRSEIQADAVASESHRGHLLTVSLGAEEPSSFGGSLKEHSCCRPEAFILMICCVPEGPTCVTHFQRTQEWTGHRCV